MEIELTSPNSFTREMTIKLTWEELVPDYDKTEKHIIKNIKMPGFRPGKVPKKIILQQYQTAIDTQFVDEIIQKYYLQALREKEITPINQAKVDKIDFKRGEPLSFNTTFEVEPQIELPELKKNSLKVQKTVYLSDEQDIEDAIKDMRDRFSEALTIEDGAKSGDYLIADLQKLDTSGVPIIGDKYESRYIKIGEGVFSGAVEAKLIGLKPAETARIDIPDSEGQAVNTYQVNVINVEQRVPAEINADFIKRVEPEAKDEQDWRRRIKVRIDENLEHRSEETFARSLSDAMIELVNPEYPPSMVDAYLDRVIEDAKSGKSGDLDEARLREAYRSLAEHNLKWYLIHNALVKQQDFKVSEAEIDTEIQRLVDRTPDSEKEIRKYYKKPSNRHKLNEDLIEKFILDYLKDFAKIKEVKVKTKDLREQAAKEKINGS